MHITLHGNTVISSVGYNILPTDMYDIIQHKSKQQLFGITFFWRNIMFCLVISVILATHSQIPLTSHYSYLLNYSLPGAGSYISQLIIKNDITYISVVCRRYPKAYHMNEYRNPKKYVYNISRKHHGFNGSSQCIVPCCNLVRYNVTTTCSTLLVLYLDEYVRKKKKQRNNIQIYVDMMVGSFFFY